MRKHIRMECLYGGALWLLVTLGIELPLQAAELTVCLDNPPATGTVAFVLFDTANAFGDLRDPAKVVRRPLDGREVYRIENVSPVSMPCWSTTTRTGTVASTGTSWGYRRSPSGSQTATDPGGHPATAVPSSCCRKGSRVTST